LSLPADPPRTASVAPAAWIKVWDLPTRAMHWTPAASVIVAFATHEGFGFFHEVIGYIALGTALLRVVWGLIGGGHAAFSDFVRMPAAVLRYFGEVVARREKRYIGHNPLGGWMILLLLANTIFCGITGWLMTTHTFFGSEWLEDLHSLSGHVYLLLVPLHLIGVVYTSIRHRENLAGAMLHGKKRAGDER
jgi:cytochrome b